MQRNGTGALSAPSVVPRSSPYEEPGFQRSPRIPAVTPEDITALCEGFIAPAIDNVERSLLGDFN